MPIEDAITSDDATLPSHSPDTQLTVKPPFSLPSIKLASKQPAWSRMTGKQYRAKLNDPSQEMSVDLAFSRVGQALRAREWFRVQDSDFRSKQQSVVEEAKGDPRTQINFILAGIKGYTQITQEEFDAKKSKGGDKWDMDVEKFEKVLKKQRITVEPWEDQQTGLEKTLQGTADGVSVPGSEVLQATDPDTYRAQNTSASTNMTQETIRAPDGPSNSSATAD